MVLVDDAYLIAVFEYGIGKTIFLGVELPFFAFDGFATVRGVNDAVLRRAESILLARREGKVKRLFSGSKVCAAFEQQVAVYRTIRLALRRNELVLPCLLGTRIFLGQVLRHRCFAA